MKSMSECTQFAYRPARLLTQTPRRESSGCLRLPPQCAEQQAGHMRCEADQLGADLNPRLASARQRSTRVSLKAIRFGSLMRMLLTVQAAEEFVIAY